MGHPNGLILLSYYWEFSPVEGLHEVPTVQTEQEDSVWLSSLENWRIFLSKILECFSHHMYLHYLDTC
jgi:hypothetical protein